VEVLDVHPYREKKSLGMKRDGGLHEEMG
jgi:hypothetical protein